jgi:hypothetical protein
MEQVKVNGKWFEVRSVETIEGIEVAYLEAAHGAMSGFVPLTEVEEVR